MNLTEIKKQIIEEMKVKSSIDVNQEIKTRINFIKSTLLNSGMQSLVLGISGGIDSTTLGKLTQMAIDELNSDDETRSLRFFAMRLPFGLQADENDAQLALNFIQPSVRLCVNIKDSVDAMEKETLLSLRQAQTRDDVKYIVPEDQEKNDFVKGNLKARARMLAQYQIAGLSNGLVLGTDHSAENITGFFTKWGDGACDFAPLFGLNKRQVKQIAQYLGAPSQLIEKTPTADLECLEPSKTDESVLGVSYTQIDDFLEGKSLDSDADSHIIKLYLKTKHKRNPIPTLYSFG